jgi:hypothetical protein
MPFNQDDEREDAMINALNLLARPDRSRQDEDAYLDWSVNGSTRKLLFECKSAVVNEDFGTGRDTGLVKLEQWRDYHFVFGWFVAKGRVPIRIWYGSPRMMRGWIDSEIAYVKADLELATLIPSKVDQDAVTLLFGDKQEITYAEMRAVMKNRWNANKSKGLPSRYELYADRHRGKENKDNLYSRDAGLKAARDRVAYLLERGVTVNNRKISKLYVAEYCAELSKTAWAKTLEAAISAEIEKEKEAAAN